MAKILNECDTTEYLCQAADDFLFCFKLVLAIDVAFKLVEVINLREILKNRLLLRSWVQLYPYSPACLRIALKFLRNG